MSDDTADGVLTRLYVAQATGRERWALALGATAVGLALAAVHWVGVVVGGALVGLCWPTLRRALVAGLGFGVVVIVAAAARFAIAGTLADVLATWPLVGVAVATSLVGGLLGATARGLLPDAPLDEPDDTD